MLSRLYQTPHISLSKGALVGLTCELFGKFNTEVMFEYAADEILHQHEARTERRSPFLSQEYLCAISGTLLIS